MGQANDPDFPGDIIEKGGEQARIDPTMIYWTMVCLANLVAPGILGGIATSGNARVGMVLGVFVVLALGLAACQVHRWAVLTVVYGGWIVAGFQPLPLMQFAAGALGMMAAAEAEAVTGGRPLHLTTLLGGLIATVVTGGVLIGFAAAFGLAMRGLAFLGRMFDGRAGD